MTAQAAVRLAPPDEAQADEASHPQVFVRVFSVPPGAPWEQARAANLEARHGAPLPVSDLMLRIQRLEAWRPGAMGRYGAFYIRSREYRGVFETSVEIEGRPHKVAFGRKAADGDRLRRLLVVGGMALATTITLTIGAGLALAARAERGTRLDALELQVEQRLRAAQVYQRQKDVAQELQGAIGPSVSLESVMQELAWVARSKAADGHILAVHWDKGLLAVEARGDVAPFSAADRLVERSEKPLTPGVWLWGVRPSGSSQARGGARP